VAKNSREIDVRVVVDARGVNVEHLAPEDFLGGPDVPDAPEQFLEVPPTAQPLETLVVQGEPLDDVLPQPLSSPDAELRAPMRVDAIAHGDDDIEVEVLDLASNLPPTFILNCCIFCNSCLRPKFPLLEGVPDVPGDDGLIALEKVCHLLEGKPDRLADKPDFKPRLTILRLIQKKFGGTLRFLGQIGLVVISHARTPLR